MDSTLLNQGSQPDKLLQAERVAVILAVLTGMISYATIMSDLRERLSVVEKTQAIHIDNMYQRIESMSKDVSEMRAEMKSVLAEIRRSN